MRVRVSVCLWVYVCVCVCEYICIAFISSRTPRLQVYDEDSIYFVNDYHTDSFLHSYIHIHLFVYTHTPSSVVKCLWEVFVWGFGVLFLSCVCVSVSGVLFSVGVCMCVCVTCWFFYTHSPSAGLRRGLHLLRQRLPRRRRARRRLARGTVRARAAGRIRPGHHEHATRHLAPPPGINLYA